MAGSAVNSDPHDGEGIKKTIAVGAAGVIPTSPRLRHTPGAGARTVRSIKSFKPG